MALNFAALPEKQKEVIKATAILVVLIFGGTYFYDSQWLSTQLDQDKKAIDATRAERKTYDEGLALMDELSANMDKLKAKQALLEKAAQKLPESPDPEAFLRALQEIVRATRINYTELKPATPTEYTVYTEIPYRVVCNARYHDFGHFLNMIEENPNRLMRVKTLIIENNDAKPSLHPVTVELATFMFKRKG